MRTALSILFIFLVVLTAASQPPQTAQILDIFQTANCEDVSSRMDMLFINLGQNPGSTAVISIPESTSDPLINLDLESIVIGTIHSRRYPADLVRIARISGEEKQTTFWLVPFGALQPEIKEDRWNLRLDLSKPRRFYSTAPEFFDSICMHANPFGQFRELLQSNPEFRGNIVIRAPGFSRFKRSRTEIIKALAPVTTNRLRFFYERQNESGEELWLVPPKRKK